MPRVSRWAKGTLAALIPVALGVAGVAASPASAGVRPLTSVSNVTATISPPSSAASAQTTYTVGFTTSASGALSASDTITVTLPAGSSADTLTNSAVNADGNQVGACNTTSATVITCGLFGGDSVPASTSATVVLGGVSNPATAGSYKLTVATSEDTTAVSSPAYKVTAAQGVSGLSVGISPTSAASGVTTYTESFTTSATGGLTNEANSRITVTLPAGSSADTLTNTAVNTGGNQVGACNTTSATVVTCALYGGESVAASTPVTVVLGGVTNPTTANSYTLSLVTTSDTKAVTSPSYAVTAAQSVSGLSVAISPTSAAGGLTTYTESFTTSATGGLTNEANSRITVTLPAGSSADTLTNTAVNTGGNQVGACNTTSATVVTCALYGGESVAASTPVTVVLGGVTNPTTAKSYTLGLVTTSDTNAVTSPSYTVTAEGKVTALKLTLSSTLTKATGVTYTVQFKADTGLSNVAGSEILLKFPAGTNVSKLGNTSITVSGAQVGACSTESGTMVRCGLYGGDSVAGGATVVVTLGGITNPGTTQSEALKVTTTSDVKTTTAHYCVAAAGVPCIAKVTPASGAPGSAVTITGINLAKASAVDFSGTAAVITTNTALKIVTSVPAGATTGSITVTTPNGTATSPSPFTVN